MKRRRTAKIKKTPFTAFVFGLCFSFISLLIVSLISSLILISTKNPLGNVGITSLISLLAAGILSGFVISRKNGEDGLKSSLLSAIAFVVIMFAVSLIFSKGKIGGAVLMNGLCYILISLPAALFGRKEKRRRRKF